MKFRDYIWGILSAICFGSLTAIGKLALIESNPETILLLRFVLVCLIIGTGMFLWKQLKLFKLKKKHIPMMGIAGLAFSFETIGFWIALENMEIIQLLALFWTFPMMAAIIDSIQERKFDYRLLIVLIIGFIGVYLGGGFL